jgi:hypothetical protein
MGTTKAKAKAGTDSSVPTEAEKNDAPEQTPPQADASGATDGASAGTAAPSGDPQPSPDSPPPAKDGEPGAGAEGVIGGDQPPAVTAPAEAAKPSAPTPPAEPTAEAAPPAKQPDPVVELLSPEQKAELLELGRDASATAEDFEGLAEFLERGLAAGSVENFRAQLKSRAEAMRSWIASNRGRPVGEAFFTEGASATGVVSGWVAKEAVETFVRGRSVRKSAGESLDDVDGGALAHLVRDGLAVPKTA